ncbi:hypothetical protein Trco_000408 [Trichoderma cornu-damae]|uniref:Uncharacterized protein n=1 Tax=Trichoderma cornu-damae TaxID=654480 RepID=A0A9P8TZ89_9HYPO|nr:hypothetical protein Trco_000408 [Trichoderma cornu-damae]
MGCPGHDCDAGPTFGTSKSELKPRGKDGPLVALSISGRLILPNRQAHLKGGREIGNALM